MVLGRQPKLGLAELESLYGGDKLKTIGDHAVIVDVDPCLLRGPKPTDAIGIEARPKGGSVLACLDP